MDTQTALITKLQDCVRSASCSEMCDFIEMNAALLFASADISTYYRLLRHIDLTAENRLLPQLILAWLAYTCGDHGQVSSQMNRISETDLAGVEERSLYYGLRAMFGMMTGSKGGYVYAKLSLDVLPEGGESVYHGNARLTYGQVLSNRKSYQAAAEMFTESSRIFQKNSVHFLSVIATCNSLLNRGRMGQATGVIEESRAALVASSSFRSEYQTYWNLLFLPMGMSYYDLDQTHMAIECLEKAKDCVDQMGLYHLHGIVELYLFKSYHKLRDILNMSRILESSEALFGHMHDKDSDLLISYFKVLTYIGRDSGPLKSDIEKLEFEYSLRGIESHPYVIDALVALRTQGKSRRIAAGDLQKYLKTLKADVYIPRIQQTQLQLVELSCREGRLSEALLYLKEAVAIKEQYGICGEFFMLTIAPEVLLEGTEISPSVFPKDSEAYPHPPVQLTVREKEIMTMISVGRTNDEISKALLISVGTAKWHISNIFSKLEVKNRAQAIHKINVTGSSTQRPGKKT